MVAGITVGLISGLRKGGIFDASALVVSLVLISLPIFVDRIRRAVHLRHPTRLVQNDREYRCADARPDIAGAGAGDDQLRADQPTDEGVGHRHGHAGLRSHAASKGLSRKRIVPVHILRNSLIPVVTYLAVDFGVLMVGATVTEGIFNVPGVGRTLYQAIIRGEGPTVVSFVTVMVLIYLVVNLLVDLLYAVLDPRIRYAK